MARVLVRAGLPCWSGDVNRGMTPAITPFSPLFTPFSALLFCFSPLNGITAIFTPSVIVRGCAEKGCEVYSQEEGGSKIKSFHGAKLE